MELDGKMRDWLQLRLGGLIGTALAQLHEPALIPQARELLTEALKEITDKLAALPAAGWWPITEPPDKPTMVNFYLSGAVGLYVAADPASDTESIELRMMAFDVGYWDGKAWRQQGTNHEVFDLDAKPGDKDKPTHYMPLPAAPQGAG